jgi:tetratricopeptide (TPR) repeat protein
MAPEDVLALLAELRGIQRSATSKQLGLVFGLIGLAHSRLGEFEEALRAHQEAASYEPENGDHPNNAAGCLMELDRYEEALAQLQEARTRRFNTPGTRLYVLLNMAAIQKVFGERDAARLAFEEALGYVDATSPRDALAVACRAADLGAEEDAVEYFARHLALVRQLDIGDAEAIDFVRESPEQLKEVLNRFVMLRRAVAHVSERYSAPVPAEHRIVTPIELPSTALAALDELVAHPPEPTEKLRRLFDEPRH